MNDLLGDCDAWRTVILFIRWRKKTIPTNLKISFLSCFLTQIWEQDKSKSDWNHWTTYMKKLQVLLQSVERTPKSRGMLFVLALFAKLSVPWSHSPKSFTLRIPCTHTKSHPFVTSKIKLSVLHMCVHKTSELVFEAFTVEAELLEPRMRNRHLVWQHFLPPCKYWKASN